MWERKWRGEDGKFGEQAGMAEWQLANTAQFNFSRKGRCALPGPPEKKKAFLPRLRPVGIFAVRLRSPPQFPSSYLLRGPQTIRLRCGWAFFLLGLSQRLPKRGLTELISDALKFSLVDGIVTTSAPRFFNYLFPLFYLILSSFFVRLLFKPQCHPPHSESTILFDLLDFSILT